MANKSRASFEKRQKELSRQEKQKSKQARRTALREQKSSEPARDKEGEDPDIAGIRPGPQPPSD